MKKAQFRPCIDLHGGKVKQIVGGTLTDCGEGLQTNFVADQPPEYFAGLYRQYNLHGGHVIRLGAGNDEAARRALSAWPGGLQLGGGVTAENAQSILDSGAAQLIVTSYVFSGGELKMDKLEEIFSITGKSKLVLDLSCRRNEEGKYFVATDRWQKLTNLPVNSSTLELLSPYACEYLIHAVDVEGKQGGIDEELIRLLAAESPLECVYAGGVRNVDDVDTIETAGEGRIHYTIGSALDIFGGNLKFMDIVQR